MRRLAGWSLVFFLVASAIYLVSRESSQNHRGLHVKVLTYDSFMSSWGPGPALAERFHRQTGIQVIYQQAGDAGLLLKQMEIFPSDVVVGMDRFILPQARTAHVWRNIKDSPENSGAFYEPEFIAFDWSPMAFIYRKGEVEPPQTLDDLLLPRYRKALALQDPRTSSPGLQFLLWVLLSKGVDGGFEFLKKLKPNVHSVSPSWSMSYGLFKKQQALLAFSYLTSPLYHQIEEHDMSYQAAVFSEEHVAQVEYAGVPEKCANCSEAELFVHFLREPESQKILLQKNYMLPIQAQAVEGTPGAELPKVKWYKSGREADLLKQREVLFARWQELGF